MSDNKMRNTKKCLGKNEPEGIIKTSMEIGEGLFGMGIKMFVKLFVLLIEVYNIVMQLHVLHLFKNIYFYLKYIIFVEQMTVTLNENN